MKAVRTRWSDAARYRRAKPILLATVSWSSTARTGYLVPVAARGPRSSRPTSSSTILACSSFSVRAGSSGCRHSASRNVGGMRSCRQLIGKPTGESRWSRASRQRSRSAILYQVAGRRLVSKTLLWGPLPLLLLKVSESVATPRRLATCLWERRRRLLYARTTSL